MKEHAVTFNKHAVRPGLPDLITLKPYKTPTGSSEREQRTMQGMVAFMKAVQEDEALAGSFYKLVQDDDGSATDETVAHFVTSKGYSVTADDAAAFRLAAARAINAEAGADGDLDDADLDGVSGGNGARTIFGDIADLASPMGTSNDFSRAMRDVDHFLNKW